LSLQNKVPFQKSQIRSRRSSPSDMRTWQFPQKVLWTIDVWNQSWFLHQIDLKCQTISPFLLVKIKQCLLLKFNLPVIHGYGIVKPVQPMDQCLKRTNKEWWGQFKKKCRISASKYKTWQQYRHQKERDLDNTFEWMVYSDVPNWMLSALVLDQASLFVDWSIEKHQTVKTKHLVRDKQQIK